jgi:hypothetical protein
VAQAGTTHASCRWSNWWRRIALACSTLLEHPHPQQISFLASSFPFSNPAIFIDYWLRSDGSDEHAARAARQHPGDDFSRIRPPFPAGSSSDSPRRGLLDSDKQGKTR